MTTGALAQLSAAGVSVWLDDLSRGRLTSGSLQALIDTHHVVGVTTNPSIFQKAVAGGGAEYAEQLATLRETGTEVSDAVRAITVADVQAACDLFAEIYVASGGVDGRVSIEVDPRLAHDTAGTIADAQRLFDAVNRPNVLIKVPATLAGLPAITELIGSGISVNVTLIFSVDRYRQVLSAWAAGLLAAERNGHDVSQIHSVASFFVSRVDTAVDAALALLPETSALLGRAAIANAAMAWQAFQEFQEGDVWQSLLIANAPLQRPLWASTGVKNPDYDDTRYVVELVGQPCVNTMPATTLAAVADHGVVRAASIDGHVNDAAHVWEELEARGIAYDAIVNELETAGVAQFIESWNDLLATVSASLRS